jgi:DNA-binding response OmpR family regulator
VRALKIIVADDDRDTVDMLAVLLRHEGHDVHRVYEGKDVLPLARLVRPDVIIMDIVVPGMSGYAVAQEMRHSFTEAKWPVMIAISGFWKERSDRRVAQQSGFDHYLMKPCEPGDIFAVLAPLRGA